MHNIPIFLSSDNNYAPFVATTIASICDNTKAFCNFYILDGGITEKNKEKICELKKQFNNFDIKFIDIRKIVGSFCTNDRYSSSTMFARFFIPNLISKIDKAIYSDVDVIVIGDIAEMYEENLEHYTLGAIQAPFVNCKQQKAYMNYSEGHIYFCSGNLLINCKKWRTEAITEKLLQLYDKYYDVITSPDQDLLNKCFDSNYKVLSLKYCVTEYHKDYYAENIDMIIRHYGIKIKPWQLNPTNPTSLYSDLELFWNYAKKTPFYNELFQKAQNPIEQKQLLRYLQIEKAMRTAKI